MKQAIQFFRKTNLIFQMLLLCLGILAASLLFNGTLKASAAPLKSGPVSMPYIEVQAEDAATNGDIIGPDRSYPSLASEAIERQAVTLDAIGEYVEFTVPQTSNAIVMRYSIPDSPDGLGLTAPLSLYINGVQQPDLTLTSKYGWFYGNYPFNNNPADIRPHHFYDDVRLLTPQMFAGDTVRVQMDASATAPSYTIDLMDFEQVAGALSQPAGSLSLVDDYSADPTGVTDATTALQTAVNDASSQGKTLWLPAGTYKLTDQISIPNNVTMQGAGMWHTTLHFVNGSGNSSGLFGNFPSSNFHAADFAIFGEVTQRDDSDQMNGFGGGFSNSTIERVWIEHVKVGAWLDGPFSNLTISNIIIRNTTADGINFHQGVTNSTVTQSILRNTGDDALAMWTHAVNNTNNTFSFNRVEIPLLANGIAIYGGKNNNVTDNYVGDQLTAGGGIHVGNRFTSVPVSGTINILRNTIVRSGSQDYYNNWNFGTGAMWFYSLEAPMSATINVADNVLIDNNYEAFHFIGNQAITNVTLNNNQIIGAGTYAIESRMTSGSVTISNTSISGLGRGGYYQKPFFGNANGDICTPPSSFTLVDGGGNEADLTPTCVLPYPSAIYGPIPTATPTLTSTPCPGDICPTPTASSTPTATEVPVNWIRIKNKWQGTYLYEENGTVKYGMPASTDATSHWVVEDYAGHQRIKNRLTGNYMHIEGLLAYVETGQVCDVCTSGQWDVTVAPDAAYWIIRSVYHPWQVINVENLSGYAEYGDVPEAWGSPQWAFETAPEPQPTPAPLVYVRIKNRWQGTYLYEDSGTVKYGAPADTDPLSHWVLENYAGNKRIKNRATGNYMHIEGLLSYVQTGQVCGECTSGQWSVEDAPDPAYKIIRNMWHTWQVINVENLTGYAEYSEIDFSYQSPQWSFETAPEPATPTPGPYSNLAQGRPIVDNGHTGSFAATNANDGNTISYWEGLTYPNALTVDLGSVQTIGSVRIKLNPNPLWAARTQTIEVLESADNVNFNSLVAATGYDFDPATGNQVTIIFQSTSTRYVRLIFTSNTEATSGQAAEFEVYQTLPGEPTATPTPAPVTYVRLRNKWQWTYLYEDAGIVKNGTPAADDPLSHWVIENFAGHQRIQNRATGNYMHIEDLLEYVQTGLVCDVCTSGQWDVQDSPDPAYKIIRSVYHPWQIINIEHLTGNAEYGDIPVDWGSPQWAIETAPDLATATPTPTATASATSTPTTTATHTPTKTATPMPVRVAFRSIGWQDGSVLESSEASNIGGSQDNTGATFNLGDDAGRKQYRGILSFNTSSIPDGAVISRVTLKVKKSAVVGAGNPLSLFQGFMADIKKGPFGTDSLQISDFQTAANQTFGPFMPSLVNNWYSINLNSASAQINKLSSNGGLTQIRLRFKIGDNNNTIANYLSLFSGNAVNNEDRPLLVIVYSLP